MHALITGASSGIGSAIAQALAEEGYDLSLVARRRAPLEVTNVRVQKYQQDLHDIDVLPALVNTATREFGPVDVLVNNAGLTLVEHTDLVRVEDAERMMRVNLLAPLTLARAVLPEMKARGTGTIVDIASVNAFTPTPYSFYYNAAKAGLAAASESLRAEVRSDGVHVMTVYPGPIATPLLVQATARFEMPMPGFALGKPEILARLIVRGIAQKRARIVYPSVFAITQFMPNLSRWATEKMFPPLSAGALQAPSGSSSR